MEPLRALGLPNTDHQALSRQIRHTTGTAARGSPVLHDASCPVAVIPEAAPAPTEPSP